MRTPYAICLGIGKSGTTSIADNLRMRSDVYIPKQKEPSTLAFMNGDPIFGHSARDKYVTDKAIYEEYFAGNSRKFIDFSVTYIIYYEAFYRNLRSLFQEKSQEIIYFCILRNPVERAWSQYQMNVNRGIEKLAPDCAFNPEVIRERLNNNQGVEFDYLLFGKYHEGLKYLLDKGLNIGVFFYDDFKKDPVQFYQNLNDYLQFDSVDYVHIKREASSRPNKQLRNLFKFTKFIPNKIKGYTYRRMVQHINTYLSVEQPIPDDLKRKLQLYYYDDNRRLEQLVDRCLKNWDND
jgi:hypothetical protein